ncbi:hypothetical protein IFM89_003557 [Coptis chinensis]|uniref:RNase H type-1 domain-containing protein n=1 Tax=Coptis chinensis TaxID=261450 RepID=A0A835GW09_9MAGN|nr:hypothetical protein IFM89_003557 [Coptis chinensis]
MEGEGSTRPVNQEHLYSLGNIEAVSTAMVMYVGTAGREDIDIAPIVAVGPITNSMVNTNGQDPAISVARNNYVSDIVPFMTTQASFEQEEVITADIMEPYTKEKEKYHSMEDDSEKSIEPDSHSETDHFIDDQVVESEHETVTTSTHKPVGIVVKIRPQLFNQVAWIKPPNDVLKLNSDGSIGANGAGYGGAIRNSRREVVLAYSGSNSNRGE